MKIGIFDSGIGGLSVLHHALKIMPNTEFLYYADRKHVPYGEKQESEIKGFVEEILNFLIRQGVDAIVIACNTATSVADKQFRAKFPVPIIGMEPAVKKAVELYADGTHRILVAATPVTIAGKKLHNLLEHVDKTHNADLAPLPGLVRFAEQGDFQTTKIIDYLHHALAGYPLDSYHAIVLGCTHFNYFKEKLQCLFQHPVHFVDGNDGTIRQLIRKLPQNGKKSIAKITYYFSGVPASDTEKIQITQYMKQLDIMYHL